MLIIYTSRLVPEVEPSFAHLSFYHSPMGMQYRGDLQNRPTHDEHQHATAKTPLRATFDEDLSDYDVEESSGSEEDRALHPHEDPDDLDTLCYRPCNGTGTLRSASDLTTAFPPSSTPTSSHSPPNPGSQNNNNRPPRDFIISLDVSQFNTANQARPPTTDSRSTNDLITSQRTTTPPTEHNSEQLQLNGPSGDATSNKGLSIAYSPGSGGDGVIKLPNGLGPTPTLKCDNSHLPGSTPTPGINGYVVNMKQNPVHEKTKTTKF